LFARGAEQRRRALDRRFQTTFDLVPSGLVVVDRHMRFENVNPAFCAMLGRSVEKIVGQHIDEFTCEKGPRLAEIVTAAFLSGVPTTGSHVVCLRRGDEALEIECSVALDADTGSAVVQLSDVTQRQREQRQREELLESEKAAREEAERSNRAKDEFLATLSHELRNPLNAILGWTSVLMRTGSLPAPFDQGLAAIDRNSKLQAQLIADLLDSAGMTFGKLRLNLATIDPHVPLKAAVEVTRSAADARGVALVARLTPEAVSVQADASRLQQIALNLLSNAIKFTDAGGIVTISTEPEGEQLVLRVQDTGKGIARDFLPRIFDRFSQEDASRSRRYSGLGLGLAITKSLVDMHDGTIEVSSGGPGQGACVTVRLPVTREATIPQRGAIETRPSFEGQLLLVVEDDADTRQLICRILLDAGAQVIEASGADAAVTVLGSHRPALMLCDIGMADRDGYTLLRRLRAQGWGADSLPAIALTAFARPEDEREALDAGFQLHLSKPVDPDHLLRSVHRFLSVPISG
jgi:PAS domain S-box-containing protein